MKKIVKGGDAVRTVAKRDSATALLKKAGIAATDYNLFINQTTGGKYAVNLDAAKAHLEAKLRTVAKKVPQKQNKGKTVKDAASNQVSTKVTAAATIRRLILDGLDNKAVHDHMVKHFGHDEDKAHYPAWYRSQMRREGLVPAKEAKPKKTAKPVKQASVKKIVNGVGSTKPAKKKGAKKAPAKAAAPSRAQANVTATLKASVKTGNKDERPGSLSVVQVKA